LIWLWNKCCMTYRHIQHTNNLLCSFSCKTIKKISTSRLNWRYGFGHNHCVWQFWKGCSDSPKYYIQCTIHSDCDYTVENIRCWYFLDSFATETASKLFVCCILIWLWKKCCMTYRQIQHTNNLLAVSVAKLSRKYQHRIFSTV
jgi:hypothetical protein